MNKKPKVSYDRESDILYISKKGIEEEFVEMVPGVNLELNKNGEVIGIEILESSRLLKDVLAPLKERAKHRIDRHTETAVIEHVIGDKTFKQVLTVPRLRPFKRVFQFRLILLGTDPPVWRRLLIPESFTFYDFHVAIQDAMNWKDYHLHHFEIPAGSSRSGKVHIECPWFEPFEMEEDWLITTETKLSDYFRESEDRALYRYDYGDGWQLDVELEDIAPRRRNDQYPACLDGALAGPPEDCGGIDGYYECVETARRARNLSPQKLDRLDSENQDFIIWLGGWDPDAFDPGKIKFESPRRRFQKALEP